MVIGFQDDNSEDNLIFAFDSQKYFMGYSGFPAVFIMPPPFHIKFPAIEYGDGIRAPLSKKEFLFRVLFKMYWIR